MKKILFLIAKLVLVVFGSLGRGVKMVFKSKVVLIPFQIFLLIWNGIGWWFKEPTNQNGPIPPEYRWAFPELELEE